MSRPVRRHRGQIMIITLLSMILLASLVFFVFNTGEQVSKRVGMQNAADSAAIGGATWAARCMNVIAMNNVAQSRLIGLAAILDSLPLAAQLTYNELNTLAQGVQAQLANPGMNDPQLTYVKAGMQSMLNNSNGRAHGAWNTPGLLIQANRLAPLYSALWSGPAGAPVENPVVQAATFWKDPTGASAVVPYGKLWVGAKALEEFNLATYNTAGPLAQATAVRMGDDCIAGQVNSTISPDVGAAFLVPVLPDLPAYRGTFLDFQNPITNGTLPVDESGQPSATIFQRGPYDQLYQWRWPRFDHSQARVINNGKGQWVQDNPPIRSGAGNIAGKPGLSPGPPGANGGSGHWSGGGGSVWYPGPQIGWTVYGVYNWALTVSGGWNNTNFPPNSGLVWYCNNYIPDLPINLFAGGFRWRRGNQAPIDPSKTCNFLTRMQAAATAKLNYMWGTAAPGSVSIHTPNWICNYDAAKAAAKANPATVVYTWIWGVRVRSTLPPTDPAYMKDPSTYALGNTTKAQNPQQDPTFICNLLAGWVDPNDPANVAQFGAVTPAPQPNPVPGVWRVDWTYQIEFDVDLGLPKPPAPPPGQPAPAPVMHTVYVRDFFVMFGIDNGGAIAVRDPANWDVGFQQRTPDDVNLGSVTLRPPRPFHLDMRPAPNFANATYSNLQQVPDVQGDPNQSNAYWYLSYLGVAHVASTAAMWPGGFVSGDPSQSVTGVAQAHVFNNKSWDLWTQHWEAQLQPVDSWDYWINQRMKGASAADFAAIQGTIPNFSQEDFTKVLNALANYPAGMADKIKTH